jgi:hypothetical protein
MAIRTKTDPAMLAEFDRLCLLEPKLAELMVEAKAVRRPRGKPFCGNAVWYGYGSWHGRGFKGRMLPLVGDERGIIPQPKPQPSARFGSMLVYRLSDLPPPKYTPPTTDDEKYLRSSRAYDVAYDVLYAALPNCRNCVCCI